MTDPKPPDRRILGIVLALAAAGALAYACISKVWLYNPRNKSLMEVGFGLLANFECESTNCRTQTNSALVAEWHEQLEKIQKDAKESPSDLSIVAFAANAEKELKASSAFPILGWVTLVACGLGALALLACGLLALAKKRVSWPIMPTTIAILGVGIGLITGCVFVALKPGPPGYVGVGLGFWAFGAGVIVGVAAALMLNKHLRPLDDPEWE